MVCDEFSLVSRGGKLGHNQIQLDIRLQDTGTCGSVGGGGESEGGRRLGNGVEVHEGQVVGRYMHVYGGGMVWGGHVGGIDKGE